MNAQTTVYDSWLKAKQCAGIMAAQLGARLLQVDGHPRIVMGQRVKDVSTWLEAWSYLASIREDQIATAARKLLERPRV